MGVKYVGAHDITLDSAALRNEKLYTAKHTLLHTTDIKVLLYMNLPGKKIKNKKITAGQQMLGRDVRMLLSGLEVNKPGWYL